MSNLGFRLAATTKPCIRWTSCRRNVHTRRELPYPIDNGLGDFLPPAALKTVAVDFQQGLLDRLSDEVRGTEQESQNVAQIVVQTGPDRSRTLAFNYASQALNNSFFLDYLKPPPPPPSTTHEDSLTSHLHGTIRTQHGSLAQLKSTFSATALGMASSGWVWLVTDQNGQTGVLPTFGAGTLLVRSRMQMGPPDSPPVLGSKIGGDEKVENLSSSPDPSAPPSTTPPTSPTSGLSHSVPPFHPSSPSRSLHTSPVRAFDPAALPAGVYSASSLYSSLEPGRKSDPDTLGARLFPLFCISVHEHAWMSAGRGVWGKEAYLREFWKVLDWAKVSRTFEHWVKDRSRV